MQHIHFLSQDQLEYTEIIPHGTFNYHPDSGYTGEATQIKIYRKTQKRQQEKDSTKITMTHLQNRARIDSTAHQQQHIQEETTKQTKPPTIWPYVIGVTILLIAAFILRKWI
ncbi:hypothetical protein SAMN05216436_13331 [bacterium A37T11]|nr:hypothetical protein SAMN05216436_13331 [bacterium A37T11]